MNPYSAIEHSPFKGFTHAQLVDNPTHYKGRFLYLDGEYHYLAHRYINGAVKVYALCKHVHPKKAKPYWRTLGRKNQPHLYDHLAFFVRAHLKRSLDAISNHEGMI